MEPINVITVCTEKYAPEYANKTLSMFSRNYGGDFTAFCITDKKSEITGDYHFIDKNPLFTGWWNKILIFGQKLPHENTLYVDLDLLIMNPINEVLEFATDSLFKFQIACFGDHVSWMNESFGSAFMYFNQSKMSWIYDEFIGDLENNMNTFGGDQIWIGKRLSSVLYLEHHFDNFVKSLKCDLMFRSSHNGKIQLPIDLEKNFMLLNCHGQPKPHQLREIGWPPINSIWV